LRTAGGTCAFGAPAIGSAGCGLDRSPGPVLALRSRGARLLPRLLRENTRAATGALLVILSAAKDLPWPNRLRPTSLTGPLCLIEGDLRLPAERIGRGGNELADMLLRLGL